MGMENQTTHEIMTNEVFDLELSNLLQITDNVLMKIKGSVRGGCS